jgi:hypothetical protein
MPTLVQFGLISILSLAAAAPGLATPPDTKPAATEPAKVDEAAAAKAWMTNLVPAANTPEAKAVAKAHLTREQQEKELKKIRAKYFKGVRNTETRQVGILKLREFTDAAIFPSLISLFQEEDADTQSAVLDHLRDLRTDEADASLAWAAVFGKSKGFRDLATTRVRERVGETKTVSERIKWVVSLGLRDRSNEQVTAAAQLASGLKLYEAIPMLINAQVGMGTGPTRADDGGDPALAYIIVGTQHAYVADVTPVVGNNAVAFDPRLGVVTDGVVLRIIDAVVVTYRVEVNAALIDLSSAGWGQSTAQLGWDQKAWRMWYANQFVPYRRQVDAEPISRPG